jgi:hypothetical protein
MNFNHVECRMLEETQGKVVNSFCILLETGCSRVTDIFHDIYFHQPIGKKHCILNCRLPKYWYLDLNIKPHRI